MALIPIRERRVGRLRVAEHLVHGPLTLPAHAHAYASLSLLLHGAYRLEGGRRSFEARAPMVVFLPAAVSRRVVFAAGPALFVWIDLPEELTRRLGPTATTPAGFMPASSGRPEWLAHRILAEIRSEDAASDLLIEGRVLELLGTLASRAVRSARSQPEWLPRAVRLINDESARIPLVRLARLCGLHPTHLARAFRQHVGCSIGEFSRQSRVSRARILLSESSLSLSAIAADCGFADQAHLSRVFKRLVGTTPSRYRKAAGARPA